MIRTIHLHGRLKKQFGASHRFDVGTAAEALRALNCAYPGQFVAALQRGSFKIIRGDKHAGMALDIELVNHFQLGGADLHIMPVPAGAANGKGVTKTIVGAALIGGAIFFSGGTLAAPVAGLSQAPLIGGIGVTWGNIAAVGLGLALSGASTLLTQGQEPSSDGKREDSFTIDGPSNVAQQGMAIPLIYGEVITGSTAISFDADIEDIGAYRGQTGSMGDSLQIIKEVGLGGLIASVVYQNGVQVE